MRINQFQRFLHAQTPIYLQVLDELRKGRKTGHWMWFIFPQHVALGTSDMAKRYGIYGVEQARDYLAHPILGSRLHECCAILLQHRDKPVTRIFGEVDARKLRSCLTLFHWVDPDMDLFNELIDVFYNGRPDALTLDLIHPQIKTRSVSLAF